MSRNMEEKRIVSNPQGINRKKLVPFVLHTQMGTD